MTDLDRILQQQLRSAADELHLPGAGDGAVAARGRRRLARRRAGAGAALAMLAVGGTVGVMNLPGADRTVATPAEAGADVPDGPDGLPSPFAVSGQVTPTLVDSTSSWRRVVPGTSLGWSNISGDAGGFAAISTSPGRSENPTNALYASADGVEWQQTAMPEGVSVQNVQRTGGRFLAVGTAPGTAVVGDTAVPDLVLSSSSDGSSWSTLRLPLDLAAKRQIVARAGASADLIHSAAGTVVAVTVSGYEDPSVLTGGRVSDDASWTWQMDGVIVHAVECEQIATIEEGDPEPTDAEAREMRAEADACREQNSEFFSWDELGVSEEKRNLLLGETTLYLSTDGTTFTELLPPAPLVASSVDLLDTGEGFALLSTPWNSSTAGTTVSSWTGNAWTAPVTAPTGYLLSSGVMDDRLVLVLQHPESGIPVVAVRTDDGGWAEMDLASLGLEQWGWPAGTAITDDGIVMAVASGYDGGSTWILESPDGITWSRTDTATIAGEPVAEVKYVVGSGGTFSVTAALSSRSGGPDNLRDPVVLVRTAG
jgi:hypothetical protein